MSAPHPLDEVRPYRERADALSSTCPVCCGSDWHPIYGPVQHEIQADGSYQPTPEGIAFLARHLPCDHDGIDWATVLVFLDWLAGRGWSFQDVHEWRPRSESLDRAIERVARVFDATDWITPAGSRSWYRSQVASLLAGSKWSIEFDSYDKVVTIAVCNAQAAERVREWANVRVPINHRVEVEIVDARGLEQGASSV